ncbi:gluconokinase [Microbacterium arabinogalactanolyticum]|uniref:gluconokinase n=1 Tax=Microbacterium arabinogalactanolyticum TaxID=69365 RepID=UPI002552E62E|nr:gluconokinase [Microbacterium arabinogalactanolyticum]GLC85694.1 gluconate kinase [Microbacterium arabinogalactanolyticum]
MAEEPIPTTQAIALVSAPAPYVLAIDIGSGSTRGCLYDAYARPIKKHLVKAEHAFIEAADGTAEVDADQIVREVGEVIDGALKSIDPGLVKAVVMDTFASSLVCVDAEGDALTPCITYADSRSSEHLAKLRSQLDEDEVHQRTGTRLHTSYHPPRLLWLQDEFPEVFAETAKFLSLGEYVYAKLAGIEGAATSTMAWAGILNRHTCELDEELLAAVGVDRNRFAPVVDPSEPITDVSPEALSRWPALEGAAWFPAVPDGFASNIGVGASTPSVAAMSAATSGAIRVIVDGTPDVLPTGLWAYRVSKTQSIVGGALNDVGRVTLWLQSTLAPLTYEQIDEVFRAAPSEGTPLVLPFLTGERATGWAGDARAVLTGISSASGPRELWRGAVEGIAISYARVFEQLLEVAPGIRSVIASGGVTSAYPGFMHPVAQALGFPVEVVQVKRVTMRGAAALALSILQAEHPLATIPQTSLTEPDAAQRDYYDDLRRRFESVYQGVIAK